MSKSHEFPLGMHFFFKHECFSFALISSDNSEDLDDSTTLKVHFKDLTCIKYRRDMYMTWDGLFGKLYSPHTLSMKFRIRNYDLLQKVIKFDFLNIASFGGIFGLCLGGSVISLVELLYFFTLRLYSIIINGTSNKFGDSKRVSISNHVKTAEMNPKSLLQDMKAYQHFDRKPTWYKMRPSLTSIGHGGTILGRTAIHDFNKPGVQAFLK